MVHSLSLIQRGFAFGKILDNLISFFVGIGAVRACFFHILFELVKSTQTHTHTHTDFSEAKSDYISNRSILVEPRRLFRYSIYV